MMAVVLHIVKMLSNYQKTNRKKFIVVKSTLTISKFTDPDSDRSSKTYVKIFNYFKHQKNTPLECFLHIK